MKIYVIKSENAANSYKSFTKKINSIDRSPDKWHKKIPSLRFLVSHHEEKVKIIKENPQNSDNDKRKSK